jgi:hypothetical protein
MKCSLDPNHMASTSNPKLTFCHSMTTMPLKFSGEWGRRTIMRVRYGTPVATGLAVNIGVLASVTGAGMLKRVAVPSKKYSSSVYPQLARSKVVERKGYLCD